MLDLQKVFVEKIVSWFSDNGLTILAILIVVFILNKIMKSVVEKVVRRIIVSDSFSSKEAEEKRENTLIKIINSTIFVIVIVVAGIMILQSLNIPIGPILAAAGIAGVALGFGGQYLIKDVISGLFIILENQYRIGDVICLDNTCGAVEDVTLRMTTIRDLDGTVHHIAHNTINKVSNLSKGYSRVNLNIGVSYKSDLNKVIKVINDVGDKLSEDPIFKDFIIKKPQFLRVNDFGDSAIFVKILGETKPGKQWDVAGEFRLRLKEAFDKEGIEIPFPQRVIHQEN
ncbi:MAG: mechanosensitive ion channel family protein [Candidatus Pacebacteria bacterium]|nr:mechanosensitive ion channel family protein [Candidatus Paceibacterota bacterium]